MQVQWTNLLLLTLLGVFVVCFVLFMVLEIESWPPDMLNNALLLSHTHSPFVGIFKERK
jgi:hypothetical protein